MKNLWSLRNHLIRLHAHVPMLRSCLCIKEESSCRNSLFREILSEIGNPLEDLEASITFEHEERDGLLEGKTNDDCRPWDQAATFRGHPEVGLEDKEVQD